MLHPTLSVQFVIYIYIYIYKQQSISISGACPLWKLCQPRQQHSSSTSVAEAAADTSLSNEKPVVPSREVTDQSEASNSLLHGRVAGTSQRENRWQCSLYCVTYTNGWVFLFPWAMKMEIGRFGRFPSKCYERAWRRTGWSSVTVREVNKFISYCSLCCSELRMCCSTSGRDSAKTSRWCCWIPNPYATILDDRNYGNRHLSRWRSSLQFL